MNKEWLDILSEYFNSMDWRRVRLRINTCRKTMTIYPESKNVFKAFAVTPYDTVKVVLLGQDPYINEHEASGLSFGITPKCKSVPQSLKTIIKEVQSDCYPDTAYTPDYTLESWANQGVLLLNTALTVAAGESGSHTLLWTEFTDSVIEALNQKTNLIWILLGGKAQKFEHRINKSHYIIKAGHPSPLNRKRDFPGSKIFSKCNLKLQEYKLETIKW